MTKEAVFLELKSFSRKGQEAFQLISMQMLSWGSRSLPFTNISHKTRSALGSPLRKQDFKNVSPTTQEILLFISQGMCICKKISW